MAPKREHLVAEPEFELSAPVLCHLLAAKEGRTS
jgi:hypothetical protein